MLTAYLTLCKPRVVLLMLVTVWVGMALAIPSGQPWQWWPALYATLGIGLTASSGAALNHWAERMLDAHMARTLKRPLPSGQLSPQQALRFAAILGIAGVSLLVAEVNTLTAILTLLSLIGYAGIYTLWLKKATPQNIVIGGLAGATPPLLGWTAMTNHIHPNALLLVLIIFTWTPPHFWALSLYRYQDYVKSAFPMLPVTHGIPFTKRCILVYTVLMIATTLLPFATGMQGLVYLLGSLIINAVFLFCAIILYYSTLPRIGLWTFWYSIVYLLLLFALMLIDHSIGQHGMGMPGYNI